MAAHLQKLIIAFLVVTAIVWSWTFILNGHAVWAAAGALLIFSGYVFLLAAEFVVLYCIQTDNAAPRPCVSQLLSAWWGEALTTPCVFGWRQPFRSHVEPDTPTSKCQGRRGVLLVHGFVCNRGVWNPWLRELRSLNIPVVAVSLEPVFGSIDDYVGHIAAAAVRLEAATGMPIVVVGHSMGGVAIRAWLVRFGNEERVHRVITIGSPHHGTWLARLSHSINGHQLRIGNSWLANLAIAETPHLYSRFTCFYGHCDNIVFPAVLGTLPGAHNIHIPATAHLHMVYRPQVFAEVCRWLR